MVQGGRDHKCQVSAAPRHYFERLPSNLLTALLTKDQQSKCRWAMLAVAGVLFTEFFGIAQPWWELGNKVTPAFRLMSQSGMDPKHLLTEQNMTSPPVHSHESACTRRNFTDWSAYEVSCKDTVPTDGSAGSTQTS